MTASGRRRDRRLRLRRLAPGAGRAAARAARSSSSSAGAIPRFAIGESSSPLANLLLEELAGRYDLPRVRPLAAWGTWQRDVSRDRLRPEARLHVLRATSRAALRGGPRRGATSSSWPRARTTRSPTRTGTARTSTASSSGRPSAPAPSTSTRRRSPSISHGPDGFVLEPRRGRVGAATPRPASSWTRRVRGGFLHARSGPAPSRGSATCPQTEGLYAHFTGVRRLDETDSSRPPTRRPIRSTTPPLHHVFAGGWIWVLRFANGVDERGRRGGAGPRERAADSPTARRPGTGSSSASRPSAPSSRTRGRPLPFVHRPALPFRSAAAAGPAWALLPSAAAFVDPLLSTGFPLTLLGIERLAAAIEATWGPARRSTARLARARAPHALRGRHGRPSRRRALRDASATSRSSPPLTMLYFAAASYAEAARRLGRPHLSGLVSLGRPSRLRARAPRMLPAPPSRAIRFAGTSSSHRSGERSSPSTSSASRTRAGATGIPSSRRTSLASRHKLGASREEIGVLLEDLAPGPSVHGV